MQAHVITIDVDQTPPWTGAPPSYRWRCSCDTTGKRWTRDARRARTGGARHVAAMERGR